MSSWTSFSRLTRFSRSAQRVDGGAKPLDQVTPHVLGTFGGSEVAFGRRNDRAFHQDVPGPGELLGVAETSRCCKAAEKLSKAAEITQAGPTKWVTGPHFQQDVDV